MFRDFAHPQNERNHFLGLLKSEWAFLKEGILCCQTAMRQENSFKTYQDKEAKSVIHPSESLKDSSFLYKHSDSAIKSDSPMIMLQNLTSRQMTTQKLYNNKIKNYKKEVKKKLSFGDCLHEKDSWCGHYCKYLPPQKQKELILKWQFDKPRVRVNMTSRNTLSNLLWKRILKTNDSWLKLVGGENGEIMLIWSSKLRVRFLMTSEATVKKIPKR